MQPAPDNNDGRIFKSKDDKVTLVASGINNAMFLDIDSAFEFYTRDISNIIYENKSERSFVVSWEENEVISYKCVVVGKGSINQFTIRYPKEEEGFYSDVVNRCYDSFIPGDLESYY